MSTSELREKLRVLSPAERREMMAVLQELETSNEAEKEPAPSGPRVSLEEAKAYLYKNCDSLLHRLAQ